MTKERVKQYFMCKNEIALLAARIEKDRVDAKENGVVHDVVKGSSKEFPYTPHSIHIEGILEAKTRNITRKESRLQRLISELVDMQKRMEDMLIRLPDPEIRMIFELVVYDGKSFKEIAKDKKCEESTIRKKYNKAFECNYNPNNS